MTNIADKVDGPQALLRLTALNITRFHGARMSKTRLAGYPEKIHKSVNGILNPRFSRARAALAEEQSYYTGKLCRNGHLDWRNTSTGQCKTCIREYFKNNPKAYYEKTAGWAKKNPEKRKEVVLRHDSKRRGKKSGADAVFQKGEIGNLLLKQKKKCINCNKNIAKQYHVDHIMPLARGGSSDISNIQLLCPPCNMKKWAKDPLVWARENGRLL